MARRHAGGSTLSGTLQRKVYNIIQKYPTVQGPDTPANPSQWPMHQLTNFLIREDPSFMRMKKPMLEQLVDKGR
jgi:hypothetical protein